MQSNGETATAPPDCMSPVGHDELIDGEHRACGCVYAPSLDEAWRAAEEAASPTAILRCGRTGGRQTRGWATAWDHGEHVATEFADTLPAALLALAARLSEVR